MWNIGFADTLTGYAVGPYGIVVRTTNGGTIWQSQNLGGTSLWFYGVDSPDPNYAWACGDGGSIYATKDGGTSWASQNSGVSWYLNSVDFVDTLFGVSVGGGYGPEPPKGAFGSQPLVDSMGTKTKPRETPPLLNKWKRMREGEKNSQAQYRVITRTLDGTTWQGSTTGETPLTGVSFVNKALGWACGTSGTVIHTLDSGATWQAQISNVTNTLYWIKFSDATHGWAVGSGGTIIATTDGGNTWNPQTSNTGLDLYSVGFADSLRGWVVGDSGLALGTTDGGMTWIPDTTQTKIPLYALSATDKDHGWTIGGFGLTLGFGRAGQVGVEDRVQGFKGSRVQETTLGQSYPNPTRGIASFEYELGKAGKVRVKVYNVAGQAVRTLVEGLETAGRHIVTWDGRDESGRKVVAGMYFYRFETGGEEKTRKMVVVR
jgi:photosystem II stability/assembly factor-like uncharacterized protein